MNIGEFCCNDLRIINIPSTRGTSIPSLRILTDTNTWKCPDEKPLIMVEQKVNEMLDSTSLKNISENSSSETVASLLERYLSATQQKE